MVGAIIVSRNNEFKMREADIESAAAKMKNLTRIWKIVRALPCFALLSRVSVAHLVCILGDPSGPQFNRDVQDLRNVIEGVPNVRTEPVSSFVRTLFFQRSVTYFFLALFEWDSLFREWSATFACCERHIVCS